MGQLAMSNNAIQEFGERLMLHVRDGAIWGCDIISIPDRTAVDSKRWRAAAASAGGIVPAMMVIADSVDSALAHLLGAIDHSWYHNLLRLSFMTERGETVYLPVDGQDEMCGWYGGPNSWRTWYSKERIVDLEDFDISDLKAEWGTENIPDDPAPILDELEMPRRAIEELGILLVQHVRDVAIRNCDEQLLPSSNTPTAQRWRRIAAEHNGVVPPEILIPDCVDEAILAFLRAIDQGLLPLSFTAENGDVVDLVKDGRGELAARYAEWRAKYSQQRFNDDNASD